jgi:putative transcriptional regulator
LVSVYYFPVRINAHDTLLRLTLSIKTVPDISGYLQDISGYLKLLTGRAIIVATMVEILRNKNQATRLQILAEIANSGPHIQQRDIARKLEVTPQAVSEYIAQLVKDGFITLEGHSTYIITNVGVNWIIRVLKEIKEYSDFIVKSVTSISVSAAIAETDLKEGQQVTLKMKDGLLYASVHRGEGVSGKACSRAAAGEDVGVAEIEGIVPLKPGKALILKIPGVKRGGSAKANLSALKKQTKGAISTGAIGIEALAALKRAGVSGFIYFYGVKEAVVEAAQHGLNPLVCCTEDEISSLIKKLEDSHIAYDLIDLRKD